MVVNRINEVLFIDTDREFSDHINKQAVELGLLQVKYKLKVVWLLTVDNVNKYNLQHEI